ncbi:unnamed protein product [Urochloa humidicola]
MKINAFSFLSLFLFFLFSTFPRFFFFSCVFLLIQRPAARDPFVLLIVPIHQLPCSSLFPFCCSGSLPGSRLLAIAAPVGASTSPACCPAIPNLHGMRKLRPGCGGGTRPWGVGPDVGRPGCRRRPHRFTQLARNRRWRRRGVDGWPCGRVGQPSPRWPLLELGRGGSSWLEGARNSSAAGGSAAWGFGLRAAREAPAAGPIGTGGLAPGGGRGPGSRSRGEVLDERARRRDRALATPRLLDYYLGLEAAVLGTAASVPHLYDPTSAWCRVAARATPCSGSATDGGSTGLASERTTRRSEA